MISWYKLPPEQAYTASAAIESIRRDFHDKYVEESLPVYKTLKKFRTNYGGSISPLIILLTDMGSVISTDSRDNISFLSLEAHFHIMFASNFYSILPNVSHELMVLMHFFIFSLSISFIVIELLFEFCCKVLDRIRFNIVWFTSFGNIKLLKTLNKIKIRNMLRLWLFF